MSEWISVKERLPRKGRDLGAIDECLTYSFGWVHVSVRRHRHWWSLHELHEPGGVPRRGITHWMPLPDPPEAGT
jgi:Protein of unknown function (DUF551)